MRRINLSLNEMVLSRASYISRLSEDILYNIIIHYQRIRACDDKYEKILGPEIYWHMTRYVPKWKNDIRITINALYKLFEDIKLKSGTIESAYREAIFDNLFIDDYNKSEIGDVYVLRSSLSHSISELNLGQEGELIITKLSKIMHNDKYWQEDLNRIFKDITPNKNALKPKSLILDFVDKL